MLTLPPEVLEMELDGYNPAEVFGNCRLYYCSKGKDESVSPLPAYLQDMELNSAETRHCCPKESYWNPITENCDDFSECYNPDPNIITDCSYDFLTQFNPPGPDLGWIDDFDDENPAVDCIDETYPEEPETIRTCCPVWAYNSLTYDYENIEYYLQE